MTALNAERVASVFLACVAHGAESHPTVTVEGIAHTAHFSCDQLELHRLDISEMLDELPREFKTREKGGEAGWSFLNACNDKDGELWTGFHVVMEQLFLLGLATGQARFCLPRDMWEVFPGNMPYIEVDPA